MMIKSATHDIASPPSLARPHVQAGECQSYYQTLLRALPLSGSGAADPVTTLGITSCYRGEGVSTVAVQLSLAAVSAGMRVLLVDLNWERPSLHRVFNVPRGPGLAEALAENEPSDLPVQMTGVPNLSVLTSGTLAGDFSPVHSLEKTAGLIHSLRIDYDLIVFDMLASAQASSTMPLSGLLDGVVLVIEAERVRWEVAQRVKELLVRSGANVLGAVMNKRPQHIPHWLYRTL